MNGMAKERRRGREGIWTKEKEKKLQFLQGDFLRLSMMFPSDHSFSMWFKNDSKIERKFRSKIYEKKGKKLGKFISYENVLEISE
jgi:hypothetical protein